MIQESQFGFKWVKSDKSLIFPNSKICFPIWSQSGLNLCPIWQAWFEWLGDWTVITSEKFSLFSEFVKVVNLHGRLKSSRKQQAELHFDCVVDKLGKILSAFLLFINYTYLSSYLLQYGNPEFYFAFIKLKLECHKYLFMPYLPAQM